MKNITIEQILKTGKEKADGTEKIVPNLKPGQFVSQGDINFICLNAIPTNTKRFIPTNTEDLQLAPGNTPGSRHCLENDENVEIYRLTNPNELQGNILVFTGRTRITHPEHGDLLFDEGIFLVSYQRQFAQDLKRVMD